MQPVRGPSRPLSAGAGSGPYTAGLVSQRPALGCLFEIVETLVLTLLIFFVIQKTRIGMIIRAGAENRDMARALGIPFDLVNRYVFAAGIALAALAGIVVAPISTVFPGMDNQMLILSFVVVVLGGIGSVAGAAIGALLIGITDSFGKVFFPSVSSISVYLVMAAVLLWRPNGILGQREV